MKKSAIACGLSTLFLAQFALAHPGHDHAHWSSNPIHLLTLAALVGTGVVCAVLLSAKKRAKKAKQSR